MFKILHIIRSNLNNNTHKISKQILMYNQSYKQICENGGTEIIHTVRKIMIFNLKSIF